VDWSLLEPNADILEFTRTVTALRIKHPVFRRRRFFKGMPVRGGDQIRDIAWLTKDGVQMTPDDWNSGIKSVAVFLNGEALPEPNARGERIVDDSFLLCFNAHAYAVEFVTPDGEYAKQWMAVLSTAESNGATHLVVTAGEKVPLPARSVLLLQRTA
jgi:glycogen operon protein